MEKKIEEVILDLKSQNLETVENAIKELGQLKDKRVIPVLMKMLSVEKNIHIKNALALSLGKLGANDAVPLLMKLIKDPENKNKNGSFIYAMQNLDCKEYFLDFTEMICTGDYEVYDHSLMVFETIVDDASFSDKLLAKERLKRQEQIELARPPSKHPKYDRIHFIRDAIKLLED